MTADPRRLRGTRVAVLCAAAALQMAIPGCTCGPAPAGGQGAPARFQPPFDVPPTLAALELEPDKAAGRYDEENLWEYLDGGAHQILRHGFLELVVGRYVDPGTTHRVVVEVFRMKTGQAAQAAFDERALEGTERGQVCGTSQARGNLLFFVRDRFYVRLSAQYFDATVPGRIEEMAGALCGALPPPVALNPNLPADPPGSAARAGDRARRPCRARVRTTPSRFERYLTL